jgi:hypothetical protein
MVLCSNKGILSHVEIKVATMDRPCGSSSNDSRPDVDSSKSAGLTGSHGHSGRESNKGSNLTLQYKHYKPPVNPRAAAVPA